ncbi:MAG: DUF386 domain-containing protein [Lachnospiraceae bacterium]|nr:DUF386 domain-containing protein [Lachnospiraceae bacterium]
MIYTTMENLKSYYGISKHLDRALAYLKDCDLRALTMGRNEVEGAQVWINRFDYETIPREKGAFEAHEKHLDIHILLSGRECIGIGQTSKMQETGRDEENDGIDLKGEAEQFLLMEPGKVLVAFPEDAHMVKIQWDESCQVEKAVVKVRL